MRVPVGSRTGKGGGAFDSAGGVRDCPRPDPYAENESMSGPIVRTGATPKFWDNYDAIFGNKKAAKKPAKKKPAGKATPVSKAASKKAAPAKASKKKATRKSR